MMTDKMDSERNRPIELQNEPGSVPITPEYGAIREARVKAVETGLSPQQVANDVFDAIENEKFYIFTHAESRLLIQQRMENILQGRNPA